MKFGQTLNPRLLLGLAVLTPSILPLPAADLSPAQTAFFEKKIRPVLASECYECHSASAKKLKGGLRLDTHAGLLAGGDSGPVIVPGKPGASLLIKVMRREGDLAMPPKKELSAQVVSDFEQWVQMGAPDPRREVAGLKVQSSIDLVAGRQFWAFQPPAKLPAPVTQRRDWARTDVDRLVLAELEKKGLTPNPDSNRAALLRRVYFDLTGLPPTPEQVAAFVSDASTDALAKVVDDLLASPRFGERWGRHWLDVARYAESNGMERNQLYPHAWRYRDYVIASFNADKPYDQFLREQIAGDLQSAPDARRRNELIVATGFLALGPKSLNERDARQFQMDIVDEQIDLATRATMAITVSCARCHDHKFDPISTEDYYGLAGIFRSTVTMFNDSKSQGVRQSSGLIRLANDGDPAVVQVVNAEPPATGKSKKTKKGKGAAPAKSSKGPVAMGVKEGKMADCPIHVRGEVGQLGKVVPRSFPAVMRDGNSPQISPGESGRRELADWIASAGNPLTARVMANRVWHHLFGNGIVRTVDNFGQTGERPANPALLDHLAHRLIDQGWSVKRLVREIVTSRVYQLSTAPNEANFKLDPENRLNWRMDHRRLDAEALRDAMLQISGRLDLRPPAGSAISAMGETQIDRNARLRDEVLAERQCRSVYLPVVRNSLPEMFASFDFAEPSMIVGERDVTTVPGQALFLLNSDFLLTQSAAFARRLSAQDPRGRVNEAYHLALGRPATDAECGRATSFLAACDQAGTKVEQAWAGFCQALLGSSEFRYLN